MALWHVNFWYVWNPCQKVLCMWMVSLCWTNVVFSHRTERLFETELRMSVGERDEQYQPQKAQQD